MFEYWYRIKSITSADGQVALLPEKGVTCVVGGNNAGKSRLLRDLYSKLNGSNQEAPVTISDIDSLATEASSEDFLGWAEYRYGPTDRHGRLEVWGVSSSGIGLRDLDSYRRTTPFLTHWADLIFRHVVASASVDYASGEYRRDDRHSTPGGPGSPFEQMFNDSRIIDEVSALAREYFGINLLYDTSNYSPLIRVGKVPDGVQIPDVLHPSKDFATLMAGFPPLRTQGDGIKAFMGIALRLVTDSAQIYAFDEPEAFLHPAQARALGSWVARMARERDLQIILATHSKDLVLGVMEEMARTDVAFIRVSRPSSITRFSTLQPEEVKVAWSDPTLRYSNVLEGLFHKTVVVCEGDADCRFYSAALDVHAQKAGRRHDASEVMFVPTGGKDGLRKPADALRRLDVSVKVIADFDLLDKKPTLTGLVSGLGAEWTEEMNANYVTFRSWANGGEVSWKSVKKGGFSAVLNLPAYNAARELVASLEELGIFVLHQGEMEDFDRSINSDKGAPWVSSAIEKNVHADNRDVRDLMTRMFPWTDPASGDR